jgi:hypothetical protein
MFPESLAGSNSREGQAPPLQWHKVARRLSSGLVRRAREYF